MRPDFKAHCLWLNALRLAVVLALSFFSSFLSFHNFLWLGCGRIPSLLISFSSSSLCLWIKVKMGVGSHHWYHSLSRITSFLYFVNNCSVAFVRNFLLVWSRACRMLAWHASVSASTASSIA